LNGKTKSKTYNQKYLLLCNIITEWDYNFYKRHLIFVKQDEKYQLSFTRGHRRYIFGFAYLIIYSSMIFGPPDSARGPSSQFCTSDQCA
jgi:hypothetical protein